MLGRAGVVLAVQLVVGDDGKVSRDPAWFAGPRRRAGAGAEGRGAEP